MNANKFSRDAAAVMMKNVNHEKLNVLGNLSLSVSLFVCQMHSERVTCVMSPFRELFSLFPLINLPSLLPPYANILNRYSSSSSSSINALTTDQNSSIQLRVLNLPSKVAFVIFGASHVLYS